MKIFIRVILVISCLMFIVSSGFFEEDPDKKRNNPPDNIYSYTISSRQINANSISAWYRNNGSFNRNPSTGNSGFEWPKTSNMFARYASGLWIGAVVGGDTLICLAEYDYEYLPGYVDNNGNPQGKDDPAYRIYVINNGDTLSPDYANWPVNQGAYTNERGKPYLIGEQTMFYTYTDGYPEAHGNRAGSTLPLKAQILQTNWCFKKNYGILNDIILTEYRIINRGNLPWTKCYISHWTDDDLGDATDDAAGCDTNINLAFTYNFDNNDSQYGINPPAVGFKYLIAGIIDGVSDTVKYYSPPGSKNLIIKYGKKFSKVSSFNNFFSGNPMSGEPSNFRETYLTLEGKRRDGSSWINPQNNQVTTFTFPGDPESNSGWIIMDAGDRRFLSTIGPLFVNSNDTQLIVIAQIIARGNNNKNSVTKLKQAAAIAQRFFDSNFDLSITSPLPLTDSYSTGDGKINLTWNDSCERVTLNNKLSGGDYVFQGYNIYRIKPDNIDPDESDTILIKTFDKSDGIKDIRDSIFINDFEGIIYGIVQRGSDNGIYRYIELSKDTVTGNPYINGSEYKFAVTAYYYDPSGGINTLPKVYETPLYTNIIKVIPQNFSPSLQTYFAMGDTIRTDQRDLAVMPIIYRPEKLKSAEYLSVFGSYNNNTAWTLSKIVNGNSIIVLENQTNFSTVEPVHYEGLSLIHRYIRDSGIVRDPRNMQITGYPEDNKFYRIYNKAWDYVPIENLWFEGPDTQAVKTAKVIRNRQYQSISIGMSFPTVGTFRNTACQIIANGKFFSHIFPTNPGLRGGPLRKIQIIFGQNSKSYRYTPVDSTLENTPYAGFTTVPFTVYAVDELDSSHGKPRKLNTGFLDTDRNGIWDPDTTLLGNYHFTYILASDYDSLPNSFYTSRNPGTNHPTNGFQSMDVMYVWHPRAKKSSDGTPMAFKNNDKLTVSPYRITRPEFVPGYPLKYYWSVRGSDMSVSNITSDEIEMIKVFPNPYYGMSELEYDSGGEKFIYFSHLPAVCDIYIYTLNGSLVRKIQRNTGDPESSLEKWDLKNLGGQHVASGMYIVYVDCKGAGTKILKIAVFTSM